MVASEMRGAPYHRGARAAIRTRRTSTDGACDEALSGRLRLHLPAAPVDLPARHVLALEADVRHDVEALKESAFLLTLGWRGAAP